jgi:hypothetical protein
MVGGGGLWADCQQVSNNQSFIEVCCSCQVCVTHAGWLGKKFINLELPGCFGLPEVG